jgi:murein DD-endopeptidase MepM/ murein hydrolase activator NlpD
VRLVRDGDDWTTEWRDLPVEITIRTAGGVVTASVAQALSHERHAVPLVPAFADIFQWDVDLLVDPRPGDQVRIVYEVRRLGAVDPDTPPYRDLPEAPGDEVGLGRILAASYDGRLARSEAFWVEDDAEDGDYYDADGVPLRKAFLRSPLNYRRISSGFSRGRMHPVLRRVVPHHGVDFAAASGTPVVAAADGRVTSVGWDGALGKAIRVRHGNGFETIYGHLRGYARGVRSGAKVEQNQVIGYVGSTGRATGPHLHYTMRIHGKAIDPLRFDNPPVEPLPEHLKPNLERSLRLWTPILASVRPDDAGTDLADTEAITAPGRG